MLFRPALALVLLAPAPAFAAPADEDGGPSLSKKQRQLSDKRARRPVRARRPRATLAVVPLTLRNQWTHEVIGCDPARSPPAADVDDFLRDHFTNQRTRMDPRLAEVIRRAAQELRASVAEIVSGYRSAKYNLMLRKKGHAVARESQHPLGKAVDFRLVGVPTRQLFRFVRSLRLGGVGYYPGDGFVHADVGPLRTWTGR